MYAFAASALSFVSFEITCREASFLIGLLVGVSIFLNSTLDISEAQARICLQEQRFDSIPSLAAVNSKLLTIIHALQNIATALEPSKGLTYNSTVCTTPAENTKVTALTEK